MPNGRTEQIAAVISWDGLGIPVNVHDRPIRIVLLSPFKPLGIGFFAIVTVKFGAIIDHLYGIVPHRPTW